MGQQNSKPLGAVAFWPTVTLKAYNPGDLVYENGSGAILRADQQTDQLTEAANQALIAQHFVGVVNGQKLAADASVQTLAVLVDCEYEFVLDTATTLIVGDLLGADEQSSGTALENQQVKKVTSPALAIAVVTRAGTSLTKAWARILSKSRGNLPAATSAGVLGPSSMIGMFAPAAAQQALSGAGAVNVTTYFTAFTSTGASQALTLANGVVVGQLKLIKHVVDGGSGVLTPVSLSGGTTITFTVVSEYALLMWNGTAWVALVLDNSAVPGTPPVLA